MADNITIKDGSGNSQTLRSKDSASVHHPVHLLYGPDYNTLFPSAAALAQGASNPTLTGIAAYAKEYNGSTWDYRVNGLTGTAATLAARTSGAQSADFATYGLQHLVAILKVTVASGTGGLKVRFRGLDPVSGDYVVLFEASAYITATGTFAYELGPGASSAAPGSTSGFLIQRAAGGLMPSRVSPVSVSYRNHARRLNSPVGSARTHASSPLGPIARRAL